MTFCFFIMATVVLFLLSCQSLSLRKVTSNSPTEGMVLIADGSFLMGSEKGDRDEMPTALVPRLITIKVFMDFVVPRIFLNNEIE